MNQQQSRRFRLTHRRMRRLGWISVVDMIFVFVGATLMVMKINIGWLLFFFAFIAAMFIGLVWMLFK